MARNIVAAFAQLALTVCLCADLCVSQSDDVIPLTTSSQCVVFYDSTLAPNATSTPRDQLSTTSITATSGASIAKTAVFTLRPYITTKDVTSTLWFVTSIMRRDSPTTYTSTVTEIKTHWSTFTTTTTVDKTVSLAATTTIPALPGFTPLAARNDSYDQVRQKFLAESEEDWELEDEYWNPYEGAVTREAIFNRGIFPTTVTCYATVWTADFHSTVTLRHSIPRQTLTRTRYVDTVTVTRRVNVYPTPANPDTSCTVSAVYTTTSTVSTHMAEVTATETATIKVYPSTTTAYAACATDNVINAIDGMDEGRRRPYALDMLRLVTRSNTSLFDVSSPNAASALDCCVFAATEPNAWFYRYQGGTCNVWIGKTCFSGNKPTRGRAELWWYLQWAGDYWRDDSLVVGNGACGGIDQISPYWRRD